jgi:hypothetical protein
MKKIKEFFLNNIFSRPKLIIHLTIVAIGVLVATLLLTGCWSEQNLFSDVGPKWSTDGSRIVFVEPTYYKLETNWGVIWVMNAEGSNKYQSHKKPEVAGHHSQC